MENLYKRLIDFHGHSCPGLAIGYRAALIALKNGFIRSKDEELVAVVENDSCSVDAIQFILGCTFGKGNLIFKDYGKQAFTIIKRGSKEGIRISLKPVSNKENLTRDEFFYYIMNSKPEELFNIKIFKAEDSQIPERARIFRTIICERCKEPVMETKVKIFNGKKLCVSCFDALSNR